MPVFGHITHITLGLAVWYRYGTYTKQLTVTLPTVFVNYTKKAPAISLQVLDFP